MLDSIDIDGFFDHLLHAMPIEYSKAESIDSNAEEKAPCNFKMPSDMIKEMADSLKIYHDLSSGF